MSHKWDKNLSMKNEFTGFLLFRAESAIKFVVHIEEKWYNKGIKRRG